MPVGRVAETRGRLEVNSTASFANFFEPGYNRLGTMRHVLALAVLVDHAFILQGAGHVLGSTPYQTSLGGLAVAGFFVLSGALITASWEHSRTAWQFARNRVLRIFPGYLVCLLVTAFVIGPLAWAVQSSPEIPAYWKLEPGPASYVLRNSLLMQFQPRIGDLFATHTEAYSINGSLWSIPWEAGCYMMVGALGLAGVITRWPLGVAMGTLALLANCLVFPPGSILGRLFLSERVVFLPVCFLGGASFYLFRHRIQHSPWLGALALVGVIIGGCFHWLLTAAFFLSYLLFYAAGLAVPAEGFPRRKQADYSYGIYIYAFPVQQLLAAAGVAQAGPWWLLLASLAGAVPLAALSWHLVEGPSLRCKESSKAIAHAEQAMTCP